MPDDTTTVGALRQAMGRFVRDRDWDQFHSPKNLAMAVAVEAAELLEHFLWVDNAESRRLAEDAEVRAAVADEVADVTNAVLALCNTLGLDLSEAVAAKLAKNAR